MKRLWAEQSRPKKLANVIFADEHDRKVFEAIVASGSLPNMLLTGHQGSGKTTISQVLINELGVHREDVLKINCSDEKIDAMRDKVKTFAYTMPMGKFKVVRLEEMDYLSQDAQALLRSLMEEVSDNCRFIATANYKNKILPAMQSRFTSQHVIANPDRDQVLVAMADLLVAMSIEFEVDDLEKVVTAGYPDMRRIVGLLEDSSRSGKLTIKGAEAVKDWKLQLLPLLETSDLKGARALVCSSATREELVDVYRFVYMNIHRVKKLKGKEDEAVVIIARYEYQHQFVSDGEIQIAAMFIELGAL